MSLEILSAQMQAGYWQGNTPRLLYRLFFDPKTALLKNIYIPFPKSTFFRDSIAKNGKNRLGESTPYKRTFFEKLKKMRLFPK
ncbi:MAG: hypothetical protein II819_04530 [Fibrobacter sp.]|nr:hypothetical protein [Fibrobacter sp.]